MRVRLYYNKEERMRFVSHLEFMKFIERFLRRAGLIFLTTQGFHKRAKMSLAPAAPFGMALYNEPIDIDIESTEITQLESLKNLEIVEGFKITHFEIVDTSNKLSRVTEYPRYQLSFKKSEFFNIFLERLSSSDPLMYTHQEKERSLRETLVSYHENEKGVMMVMKITSPIGYLRSHFGEDVEVIRVGYEQIQEEASC